MKNKIFKLKSEWIMLFSVSLVLSMIFTPIVNKIYTETNWNHFKIEYIQKRLKENSEKETKKLNDQEKAMKELKEKYNKK